MENLTDEQVTNWKDSIVSTLEQLYSNLFYVNSHSMDISNLVKSNDMSLSNSWSGFAETIRDSNSKLTEKKEILDDTLTTFVNTVISINEKMVSTVQLAENEFTDFYNRIAAV